MSYDQVFFIGVACLGLLGLFKCIIDNLSPDVDSKVIKQADKIISAYCPMVDCQNTSCEHFDKECLACTYTEVQQDGV